jgi:hypothetical protein
MSDCVVVSGQENNFRSKGYASYAVDIHECARPAVYDRIYTLGHAYYLYKCQMSFEG